jgi:1-acyl-sn-glycerol-3-phosphate acyltransferase
MIYSVFRWIAGIALHWFYRDIRVVDEEKIPLAGPLLIAVNHRNALVDSLLTGWVMPRKTTMTAKATLLENPFVAALFKIIGVVPLRRASDESRIANGSPIDRSRNTNAFRDILQTLEKRGAVLIFPEGKSHNEAGLEPLRTGLARLALQARDRQGIRGVRILPIGLVFEDKGTPGSGVEVRVGDAIDMGTWSGTDPVSLTAEIAERLRKVSDDKLQVLPEIRVARSESLAGRTLIPVAAMWGRLTHQAPIQVARNIALSRSRDADQPAMLTITFGVGLVLAMYVLQIVVVGTLVGSFWVSVLYLASLVSGAYWAAFEKHPQRR